MDFLSNWKAVVLLVIFCTHSLWLAGHMYIHSQDALNPWKLGGYAMYVEPKRSMDVRLYSVNSQGLFVEEYANLAGFTRGNFNFNFYCKSVSESSLRALFAENKDLYNKDLQIYFYSPRFYTDPLRTETEYRGVVRIVWQDENSFTYQSNMCGERGSVRTGGI